MSLKYFASTIAILAVGSAHDAPTSTSSNIRSLLRSTAHYIPGAQHASQRYHRQILKALRRQDPELAEKTIRLHIADFTRAIRRYQRMKSTW
jgi:DNA-binding FadR family transcriptional regulator